jgi:hypothetical protein
MGTSTACSGRSPVKSSSKTRTSCLADHGERFFGKARGEPRRRPLRERPARALAIWGPDVRPQRIDSRVSLADVTRRCSTSSG